MANGQEKTVAETLKETRDELNKLIIVFESGRVFDAASELADCDQAIMNGIIQERISGLQVLINELFEIIRYPVIKIVEKEQKGKK